MIIHQSILKSPLLSFGGDNAKLSALIPKIPQYIRYLGYTPKYDKQLATFSKLSGITCPYSKECQSKAIETKGILTVQDGQHTLWRCYSASQEALYPNLYKNRKHNTELVGKCQSVEDLYNLIANSLPKVNCIRLFVGGDFSRQLELDAWVQIAKDTPHILFYGYTKSLPFWVRRINDLPKNFILTASLGGWKDNLIEEQNLRYTRVVFSRDEAKQLGLKIDKTDELAANPRLKFNNFALLIHGVQPKNTEAAKAWQKIKVSEGGYKR